MGCRQILGVGIFGEVERHQRLKGHPLGQGGQDPVAICCRICTFHHRGHQVGHDDRTGKITGSFGQDGLQHGAVAQVQVPVIGAGDGELNGHGARVAQGCP